MEREATALTWMTVRQSQGRGSSVVNILRRLPLSRLLLLWALVIALGASATALAYALGSGPTPPAKPLAQAIHDALAANGGQAAEGVTARVTLTNHLLEGANLATGGKTGELTSNPLLTGASGRLWVAKDGDVRIELDAENGDTEIYYDGQTISVYDTATNTLYRYTPPAPDPGREPSPQGHGDREVPSVAKIEEAISKLSRHANVSGATPTDVAGQPAYTVRVSPKEGESLLGGAELSFDANTGIPLRAAIYSVDSSSSPVIELAATEVSYGPVSSSVFEFTPPANAKVKNISTPANHTDTTKAAAGKPKLTSDGHGLSAIAVLASSRYGESKTSTSADKSAQDPLKGLPQVSIDGVNASELRTELGTVLSFERSGVRYVLAGSVAPSAIEALARGL
jgi:outer membrane lipoprotein-sorting protein